MILRCSLSTLDSLKVVLKKEKDEGTYESMREGFPQLFPQCIEKGGTEKDVPEPGAKTESDDRGWCRIEYAAC